LINEFQMKFDEIERNGNDNLGGDTLLSMSSIVDDEHGREGFQLIL